jgi:hypothetical protein
MLRCLSDAPHVGVCAANLFRLRHRGLNIALQNLTDLHIHLWLSHVASFFVVERVLVRAWAECRVVFGGTGEVGSSCISSREIREGSVPSGRNCFGSPPLGRGCSWFSCLAQQTSFVRRILLGSRAATLRNALSLFALSFTEIVVFERKL